MLSGFKEATPDTRRLLEQSASRRHFDKGQDLILQGMRADEVFLILSGRAKMARINHAGISHTLLLLGPGELVGSIAVTQDRQHSISATATSALDALSWTAETFRDVLRRDVGMSGVVLRNVAARVEKLVDRFEDTVAVPVEERLARLLLRLSGEIGRHTDDMSVAMDVGRQELAEMVFSTMPTVSRIMSRWRRAGIVDGGRGQVVLLDVAAIGAIAGLHVD